MVTTQAPDYRAWLRSKGASSGYCLTRIQQRLPSPRVISPVQLEQQGQPARPVLWGRLALPGPLVRWVPPQIQEPLVLSGPRAPLALVAQAEPRAQQVQSAQRGLLARQVL